MSLKSNDVKKALKVESIFNNKNYLLVTFHEQELTESIVKELHSDIINVHLLQNSFVPKRRCLIEIKNDSNINHIKDKLLNEKYGNGYLTVDLVKNLENPNKNIDPCTLHVKNLLETTTDRDVSILFPGCLEFSYLPLRTDNEKSVLVRFRKVEEAIEAFKCVNNISYKSNILMIEFHRLSISNVIEVDDKSRDSVCDCDSSDEVYCIDDQPEANAQEDNLNYVNNISRTNCIEESTQKIEEGNYNLLVQKIMSSRTLSELIYLFPSSNECIVFQSNSKNCVSIIVRFTEMENAMASLEEGVHEENLDIQFLSENDLKRYEIKYNLFLNNQTTSNQKEDILKKNDYLNCVLQIENLPVSITLEDIKQLCPRYRSYKILPFDTESTVSLLVSFKNISDTKNAYKHTNNLSYKTNILKSSIQNNQNLVSNPLAKQKRKSNGENSNEVTLKKRHDEVRVKEFKCEDDVDEDSDDDRFSDDCFVVLNEDNVPSGNEDNDDEEFLIDGNDCQHVELDNMNTCLPVDDDDY